MSTATIQMPGFDLTAEPHIVGDIKYGVATDGLAMYRYDTVDRARTNLVLKPYPMNIYDASRWRGELSYAREGVCVRTHGSKVAALANTEAVLSKEGLRQLRDAYLSEMTEFIRELSGTPYVYPQPVGFFVRHGVKSKIKTEQKPAALPHVDFTEETALQMAGLIQRIEAPDLSWQSFAIYQTWRAVSPPPQDSVLCFCDARASSEADFRLVESIMGPAEEPGNVYKMEMALHNPRHQWFYFPNLTERDVLVFQGYDQRSPRPILHTSVANPVPGATPRVSIECRHYAFFK